MNLGNKKNFSPIIPFIIILAIIISLSPTAISAQEMQQTLKFKI